MKKKAAKAAFIIFYSITSEIIIKADDVRERWRRLSNILLESGFLFLRRLASVALLASGRQDLL